MIFRAALRKLSCLLTSCRTDIEPDAAERERLIHDMQDIPQRIDRLIERHRRNPVERTVWPDSRRRKEPT